MTGWITNRLVFYRVHKYRVVFSSSFCFVADFREAFCFGGLFTVFFFRVALCLDGIYPCGFSPGGFCRVTYFLGATILYVSGVNFSGT